MLVIYQEIALADRFNISTLRPTECYIILHRYYLFNDEVFASRRYY